MTQAVDGDRVSQIDRQSLPSPVRLDCSGALGKQNFCLIHATVRYKIHKLVSYFLKAVSLNTYMR